MASKTAQEKFNEIRAKHEALTAEMFGDLFPHAEPQPGDHWSWKAPEGVRAVNLKAGDDVQVGDVVVVSELKRYRGAYPWNHGLQDSDTIRKVATNTYNSHLAVVTTVKGSRITVEGLIRPGYYGFEDNTFGRGNHYAAPEETFAFAAQSRMVVKVGTFDALTKAWMADPRMPALAALTEQREAAFKALQAEEEREKAARDATRAPFEATAKALNEGVGVNVFNAPGWGDPRVEYAGGDSRFPRLVPALLVGRLTLGEITQDQYDAALEALGKTKYAPKG